MSDNEDLLSYEIGDVDDHDDGHDLDAVEDELLMSDDEHNLEDDRLPSRGKHVKKDVSTRASNNEKQSSLSSVVSERSKSTVEKVTPKKRTLKRNVVNSKIPSKQVKQLKTDVTDENSSLNVIQESQSNDGAKDSSLEKGSPSKSICMAEPVTPKSNKNLNTSSVSEMDSPAASLVCSQSGDTATTSQDESFGCAEESESESASLTQQSQDTSSVQNSQEESVATDDFDSDYNKHKADTELEDSDDCTERMNARLCVERDVNQDPQFNQVRPPFYKNQRGGLSPRSNIGPRPSQSFPPQFNSFGQRPNNFHPRFGPPMMPPPNPQIGQQRMDFRGMQPLNFRPPYQNNIQRPGNRTHFTQHGHAVNRPNFPPNAPPNGPQFPPYMNNSQPNPMGNFEPNGPRMYPQRPPFGCPTAPFAGPRHETAPPHIPPTGLPSIVPRKVLINPNFKGGVQAATNQLMMDTIGNPQFMSAQSDAELLRQQEAFINKNRMHIEKRRYERSPDRDRERERSYSPPRRERRYSREREIRKPMYSQRGRGQRAGSREPPPGRPFMKRRRSASLERDKLNKTDEKPSEPEDEETKKYRLEIEKQKSMREKILRDKEMRRRQAAEEKTKDEEKKPAEELTTKLTPIIVTEKKIISLKKKTDRNPAAVGQRPIALRKSPTDTKKIDASSVAPTISKPTKPVLRIQNQRLSDLEDYDEDELLADSPTPPPNPIPSANITGPMFTNRRVVLTTSSSTDTTKQKVLLTKNTTAKGIFDRLEAKIGVNEAAKRKIQKIIIKSND